MPDVPVIVWKLLVVGLVWALTLCTAHSDALNPGTARTPQRFRQAPDVTIKPTLAPPRNACGAALVIKERLEGGRWSEELRGLGLYSIGQHRALLYVAPSGTWTVLLEDAGGTACIIAAGTNWNTFSGGAGS